MKSPDVASRGSSRTELAALKAAAATWATAAGCALVLVGCASEPEHPASANGGRYFDSKLGVWASPRLVADGEAVPRGGGGYLVGRPYVIGGQTYYPNAEPKGYSVVGTASWYGDAFHGRRTANGEVFDKGSITAAHPTLPLPSYVRVTNLKNAKSMIVRVNDRGPYHGGRVMDVSQRVAEALSFKGEGTARIRVDYIGRASLSGSDDEKLIATLRDDGAPAQLAEASPPTEPAPPSPPPPPVPSEPAPLAPPPPRQPVLAAARISPVGLGVSPALFAPLPEPRRSPHVPPPASGRVTPFAIRTGVATLVGKHRKSGPSTAGTSLLAPQASRHTVTPPRPPARPVLAQPGDDAAEAH